MNTLQAAFEKQLLGHFSAARLMTDLIARKAKESGVVFSKRQAKEIERQLEAQSSVKLKLNRWKWWERKSVQINITDQDILGVKRQFEAVLEDLPGIIEEVSDSVSIEMLSILKKRWSREAKVYRQDLNAFQERLIKTWQQPLEQLEMLIRIALDVGDALNNECRATDNLETPHMVEVMTRLHARSCQVAAEILLLLKNGFADGAMARWRTLHEIAVTAFFIQDCGETVAERYLFYNAVESFNAAKQYQRFCNVLGYEPFSDEEMKHLKDSYFSAIKKFGEQFGENYGWTAVVLEKRKRNFVGIEESVGLGHLRPFYKMACHNVHANPKGILHKLGLLENEMLLAGPSNIGLADPGQNTALSLTQMTTALIQLKFTLDTMIAGKAMLALSREISEAFTKIEENLQAKTA